MSRALRSVVPVMLVAAQASWSQAPVRLTLEEAEATAVKNNPQIGAALLQSLAAEQIPLQLRAAYYPTAFGSLTGVKGTDGRLAAGALSASAIVNRVGSGMSISQMITDFGRTANLVASSRYRADSQRNQAQATRALVLLQVDRAYLSALRSQAVLRVAEQTVSARQLVADQVAELAKAQLKSGLDASFANVNLSEARLLLLSAQDNVRAAHTELSTAMGYAQPQTFDLTEVRMPVPPSDDSSGFIAQALRDRPEVASLRAEVEAGRRLVEAEKALRYPTISAAGSAGFIPFRQDEQLGRRYGALGVNINIPVFNGHLFSSRRTEADLRAQAAAQNLRDLENRITRDVTTAWLQARTAYERLALSAALLDQAVQALDLAQSRYDLGLSSIVELSQAQLNKTAAEIQNASAKYELQIEDSVLRYHTGALR